MLLSPDEGDEFSINPAIPSYELLYMFFTSKYNPLGALTKTAKFRRWGDYYTVVYWVVNEHRIKGVKKKVLYIIKVQVSKVYMVQQIQN
ncbi:hypothetical protein [Flavobacterium columnare]|uniref:Uncharacterized protein n=1 Tax=Flavobacterium columnare TaxID=996 RepID=A0AA94F4Z2_9FLAO|nr:hypothetical protein [Flavobacterium columnare]MCH4830416.1 hypothetical protein [Flavobacterium columnare]MCH4833648.1 hypothetical protein [Flavobacterium columnare]